MLHALVFYNPLGQDLGFGEFEAKSDCTMKLRSELGADRPELGETLTFQGVTCLITRSPTTRSFR